MVQSVLFRVAESLIGKLASHAMEEASLAYDEGEDESLSIVPIVGIGGLGKTTPAKLIFNDESIDNSFSLKIWVCVFKDFKVRNLLVKILSSALNSTQEMYKNLEMQ
ncbi:hypothetical protein RJT34_23947 [Clitoria ternatea]|uniref:NB-ARC domain-containing protein n=1 Tax=Clitoria ternatea TaxID=43366 RepID=A0AAN9FTK2_CLITE